MLRSSVLVVVLLCQQLFGIPLFSDRNLTVQSARASEKTASGEAVLKPRLLQDGNLGMVVFMLEGKDKSEEEWKDALRQMHSWGVKIVEIGQIAWADTETEPGKYDWTYAKKVLKINKEEDLGFVFVADIGMFINPGLNGKPKLPKHLKNLPFDDPQVIKALSDLYKSFFDLEGSQSVKYLFQHFENADDSFKKKEADRARVKKLLKKSFIAAKKIRPDIKTGVCIESYKDPHYPAHMIKDWNTDIDTDVLPVISFGPNHFEKNAEADFEKLLKLAAGKPIALNEFWYHSSKKADSSPEKQAQFVKEMYALLKKHHRDIEFATWYEYKDLGWFTANFIGAYLSVICLNPLLAGVFKDRMGSCGMIDNKGKEKPALKVWKEEARKYYEFREKEKKERKIQN